MNCRDIDVEILEWKRVRDGLNDFYAGLVAKKDMRYEALTDKLLEFDAITEAYIKYANSVKKLKQGLREGNTASNSIKKLMKQAGYNPKHL